MKQKTLQEQYNLIKEGKGNTEVFMKAAKKQFPNIILNAATLDQTISGLKRNHIISESMLGLGMVTDGKSSNQPDWFSIFNSNMENISEEAKVEEKKTTKEVEDLTEKNFDYEDEKNIDNIYGEQFLKGYYVEMKDPKNADKTVEELKTIVSKNLTKDRLFYVKNGQFGEKGVGYTEKKMEEVSESKITEAKPAGLSKEETLEVAQKFAAALTKLEGMKYTVNSDYEEDSFDLDIEDQDDVDPRTTGEYAGGSYNINADGSVVNMAVRNKSNQSPVYGDKDDDVKTIMNTIKNLEESGYSDKLKKSINEYDVYMPSQEEVDKFFALTHNETHYLNSKPVMGQEGTSNLMPIEPWDEYDYSNWMALVKKAKQRGKSIDENKILKQAKLSKESLSNKSLNEQYFDDLESAKEYARTESEEGFVQHVNRYKEGFKVEDWLDGSNTVASYEGGDLLENLDEIGMFNDPIGYVKSKPQPKIFTKKYISPGVYDIFKNGVKIKTIKGEGEANAYMNQLQRELKENKSEKMKKKTKKETTDTKLAEIEKAGKVFVLEAQIEALAEIIESKQQRISMVSEDENLSGLVDSKKVKEMQKEIKLLEKQKLKLENLYEKTCGKSYSKKEMVGEEMAEDAPKEFEAMVDKAEELYDELGTIDAVLKQIPSEYKLDIERHLKGAYGNE